MNFNEQQLEVINTINQNVVALSAPATGKTAVIVERIRSLVEDHHVEPDSILAISYNTTAKENIRNRLNGIGFTGAERVNVETFHSMALKVVLSKYRGLTVWTTEWQKQKLFEDLLKAEGYDKPSEKDKATAYNDFLRFMATQKVNMISYKDNAGTFVKVDGDFLTHNELVGIWFGYERYKEDNNYIEFDDMLNIACKILTTDKRICNEYQSQLDYVLADEFQDASMSRNMLIELLGAKTISTMVVGDVLQNLYAYNGASSKYIIEFEKKWNAKVINMNTNYRCSADIVKASNTFAEHMIESKGEHYTPSVTPNPSFMKPQFTEYSSSVEEAMNITSKIKELLANGYEEKDIAVLARTNAQLQIVAMELSSDKIKFASTDGCLFTESTEIKILLSYLRLAYNNDDDEAFEFIYNKPLRWLAGGFLEECKTLAKRKKISLFKATKEMTTTWKYKKGIAELTKVINFLSRSDFDNVGEMIDYLRETLDIDAYVTKGKIDEYGQLPQIANMDSFREICSEYNSLENMFTKLNELKKNNSVDGINLLSIHRSKGLEFPVVFVIGCNEGLLPHFRANSVDEEKRLMYVAVTRAKKELYLSSCGFHNGKFYGISSFIDMFENTIDKITGVTVPKQIATKDMEEDEEDEEYFDLAFDY